MEKILSTILFALVHAASLLAQPLFVPDGEIQKVGEIEFQRPKQVTFGFTNKGNMPLQLLSVHPSCGCLDVQYTKTAVNPGERGEIRLTYDARMLGVFHKEVEIVTNASDEPYYLSLEGVVTTEVTDYGEGFPIDLGNVRLATNYIEFDDVNKGDTPVVELRFLNVERTAFRPELMHLPPYLSVKYEPEDVPPGKVGKALVTLDSEKLSYMGLNQTSIYLARYLGDKVSEANEILVSAVLLPDFSGLTEAQLAVAPELFVPEPVMDFGSLGGKQKLTKTTRLLNMGKSDLHIKQVQVFNKAVTVSIGSKVLKPGKSTKVKITLWAKYLSSAKSTPRVLLITDDPKHPKEIISVEATP